MTYLIDARLEKGRPALTLIDAATGEERLHWRDDGTETGASAWQTLFKRLVLLSCTDGLNLNQRAQSPGMGEECLECADCLDNIFPDAPDPLRVKAPADGDGKTLRRWRGESFQSMRAYK